MNINSITFTNDCCILSFAEGTIARSEFLDVLSTQASNFIIIYNRYFLPTLLATCALLFVGDEDFVADPTVSTIVLSGSETRKCAYVTIIDDQTVERTEPFAVTFTFPPDQPALQSGEIVPHEMQINGLINIIDDDGELI